jgi:hypothetical protein
VKLVITILLALVVLLQPFSKLWIYTSFKLNQKYITSHFCVNKDKPKMHCNGHCHLKKELAKDDSESPGQAPQNLKDNAEELFCNDSSTFTFYTTETALNTAALFKENFYTHSYLRDIFHPPMA